MWVVRFDSTRKKLLIGFGPSTRGTLEPAGNLRFEHGLKESSGNKAREIFAAFRCYLRSGECE
jgi:hypothetical protein